MESYLELFISETEELIKQLNKELLNLEVHTRSMPSVLEVFRIFHSIKGMAQTMGFEDLAQVAHRVEDLLGDAKKKGEIELKFIDFLFIVADFLTVSLQAIKNRSVLPSSSEIIETMEKIARGEAIKIKRGETTTKELSEIRIKMKKLDKLFNLTHELLIAKSRFVKLSQEIGTTPIITIGETISRLVSSLQDEVMRLRMLPLSTVFEFFPRWLRDEAKREEKEVEFEITGGDIEVDRSIIDVLKEPLMHLLRNALDHGIVKKGKISLKTLRERERIKISVIDNGKGIDLEEIRRLAVERKIVPASQARDLTKDELLRILLNPNFSTKETVSTISGRGIGLDIVNSLVTKMGGRLEIVSEKGKGACFTVELPLSLAIVRAMIFILDGQRFALPLNYVQETFYLEEGFFKTVFHRELFALRDEILPLVSIGERLNCPSRPTSRLAETSRPEAQCRGTSRLAEERKSVIVVQHEAHRRGFVTDEIIGEEEIVVKKLDPLLPSSHYSGCSIYADGEPILILDPRGFE